MSRPLRIEYLEEDIEIRSQHSIQFTYDSMGNVLTKQDARNKVWTYTKKCPNELKLLRTVVYRNYYFASNYDSG